MADAQDLVEALMADAQDVPDDMTLGDLARRLRERALERLGHDADVRLPVLHVLLAAVVGERPPNASELVACLAALPSDRQSTVEEGQHALRGVLRIFAACTAGGQSLLIDDAGVLTFVAVVQAFVFSDAISFEALLAWHEDRALDRELEARGLSAHDPRQSAPWRSVLGWARAAIARLESDQEKGGVCGAATAEAQSPELVACAKTSTWRPSDARIALYVELGGGAGETIVVVDGLVDEGLRAALLDFATAPGWDHSRGPPSASWTRGTSDGDGLPRSWGLKPERMRELKALPAAREVHARLCALYPRYAIAHMPEVSARSAADGGLSEALCTQFVGNATVPGDSYSWHVDADPAALEPAVSGGLGGYVNGTAGRPLFVSLLVYLNPEWRASWDGETLFRDPDRSTGVLVQPMPGRAILMVQDVLHRASAPSASAPAPRYSLVWKLLFIPPEGETTPPTLRRAEWGEPAQI